MRATIRGEAMPFETIRHIGGDRLELVNSDAFNASLARSRRVLVRWDGHESDNPVVGVAEVFAGADALRFSLTLSFGDRRYGIAAAIGAAVSARGAVSIGFATREARSAMRDGMRVEIVTAAALDHIALIADPTEAAYPFTKFWRADADANLDEAPIEIREADRRWRAAHAAAKVAARQQAVEASARKRRMKPIDDFINGDRSYATMMAVARLSAPPWTRSR